VNFKFLLDANILQRIRASIENVEIFQYVHIMSPTVIPKSDSGQPTATVGITSSMAQNTWFG
jgi:hypothetical protein